MKKWDFNKDWHVKNVTQDGAFLPVSLPHDAMLSEPRTIESRGGANIGWYAGHDYEYQKTFDLPAEARDKHCILEFEGVFHKAKVYLNDREPVFCPYGYSNFYVDADDLKETGNELRVEAYNSDQPNSRWYTGTGIYRPVWLWIAQDKTYIPVNGIKVRTENAKEGTISVEVKTSGSGDVTVEIFDGAVSVVKETGASDGRQASFSLTVPDAKCWSCDTPHRYRLVASFGKDTAETYFGIRTLDWNAAEGLLLNGQRVILRGACIHHDNGPIGACTNYDAELRRVRLLKQAGYNAIRSAHNPCSKYLLDACDELGMLVMDEYIDHWYIHKTKYDYVEYMPQWWKRDLKAMVEKDFNHPSVILYSTGNEVAETSEPKGIHWQEAMTDYLHCIDGTRPVTCGINIFFNFLYSIGLGQYSDEKAESEAASHADQKKPVGSEFYNVLAVKFGTNFMKLGATLPPSDWKTRDAYAVMDIAGYNYGLWRYRHDRKKYPDRLILGTETFCSDAAAFWDIAKEVPQIIGDFVWSGMDYIGETGAGAAEYATYSMADRKECAMTGGNGRIDITGKLKPEAYYTLVAFEQETGPFLAVHPVYESKKPAITGWALTSAIESWSFAGCDGKETEVEVYARADAVELFVNGISRGRKKVGKQYRTSFTVTYETGTLEAVAYDAAGKEVGRRALQSAAGETVLYAEPETKSVASGHLCYIRLRYGDREGITKVMEKHRLDVSVEGGRLLGLASGCSYVEGNYTDTHVETYYGEALAVVEAQEEKELVLYANDDAGHEAKVSVAITQ